MTRTLMPLLGLLAVLAAGQARAADRDNNEPNNSFDKATTIKSGKTTWAAIDPAKDFDGFALDVPKPGYGLLEVMIRNVPAAIRPKLELFDPAKKSLGQQRRAAGTSLFHRILIQKPGRYFVSLSDVRGTGASPDVMSVTATFRPIDRSFEPNETPKDAKPLAFGKVVGTTLFPAKDLDFYKITVPKPGYGLVTVRVVGGDRPPSLTRVDAKGESVYGYSSRQIGKERMMVFPTKAPGEMLLKLRGSSGYSYYSGLASNIESYAIRADYEPAGGLGEPNNDAKTAASIKLGEPVSGRFFPAGDKDYYKIDVPRPGIGRIEVVVSGVPEPICPRLYLYDAKHKQIGSLQRGFGAELRFRHEVREPGAYVLNVHAGDYGEYGRWGRGSASQSDQSYKLVARFVPVTDPHEPNGKHDTAKALKVGEAVTATLFPKGDVDFYKFSVPANTRGALRIEADGFSDMFQPYVRLYNAAKRQIKSVQAGRNQALVLTEHLRAGGDFYVEIRDNNRNTASAEPYTLKVTVRAAQGAEPNDKIEQAETITFGKAHEASLFPGNDPDFFKVNIAQPGPVRIQVGDFAGHIQARVVLYGPDKRQMLALNRHAARLMLDADIKKPGTHYVLVHPSSFQHPVRGRIGTDTQFDTRPYRILVSKPVAPAGGAEAEPNNTFAAAQAVRSGQTVLGKIAAKGDRDWFRIQVDKPSMLDVALPQAPDKLDPQMVVYHLAKPAGATKKILYLHGPRRECNLNNHLYDMEVTRLEQNTPAAKAALGNLVVLRKYDAIIADCLHDPKHLDLNSPRVQANINAYVQGGGRFIMLSPFTGAKLFGVEIKEPGRWHRDVAVNIYTQHPLLKGRAGKLLRWSRYTSIGYFVNWENTGFKMLVGRVTDPEKHAMTLAKQIGRGYLILDAQMASHDSGWPRSNWKLRAFIGAPQAELLAHINATQLPDRQTDYKRPEFKRVAVRTPGTIYIGVLDTLPTRSSPDPYALTVTARPINVPSIATDLFAAKKLDAGTEATFALPRPGQAAWFKVDAAKIGEMKAALRDVPPDVDPQMRIFEGLADPAKPARVLYLHGERGDFNLDRNLPDIRWTRMEWNDERAHGVLLKLENFSGYDAVVVDAITRPGEFGLARPTAVKNIEAYARGGGRFIVLSPLCKTTLFGVELGETNWRSDTVREVYPVDPLFAGRPRTHRVNGWPGNEAFGYWLHNPASGFKMAFADWRDPARRAITLVKRLGKGMIVLDAQLVGNDRNAAGAAWKLYTYLGRKPAVRFVKTVNNSESAGFGGGERTAFDVRPATYYVEVTNRARFHSIRPMRLALAATAPDRPLEADDSPGAAKPAILGQEMPANIYPAGDEDWRLVRVPGRGALTVRLTDLPDNIDPVIHIRRRIDPKNPVRVLYLEGDSANEIDPERYKGAVITRVDANQRDAGKALDGLGKYQVVILSAISDARQFGLNNKAAHDKLRRFVEAGGRCVVLHPAGCSFALNSVQMGGRLESASSQYDDWSWSAIHACDGYKTPGQSGTGWCCKYKAPFPHTLTWSLGGSKRVDRAVLYNFASGHDRRTKDFELLVSNDGKNFRSLGKYVAAQTDSRQEFRFNAVTGSHVRINITSNYGHKTETQFGELEFYGPGMVEGFFDVPLVAAGRSGSLTETEPLHWILKRGVQQRPTGWPGENSSGWWVNWGRLGFKMVCADGSNVRANAVTLFKTMGKGWVVLDTQRLTHPKNVSAGAWKLRNYLGTPDLAVLEASRQRRYVNAADEVVEIPVMKKGAYLVRVTDRSTSDDYANRAARSLTFRATFKSEENDYEPNDTAAKAARLDPGETVAESIFPAGDADWYRVPVERAAALDVWLDNMPSGIRPVVEVHRAPTGGKTVKLLYLAGTKDIDLDRRVWGPARVKITRVDAGAKGSETIMQRLGGYDVVILDGLSDVRHFGMDRSDTQGRIQKFAGGGGRFVFLAPRGFSFSLLAREAGASSEGSSTSGSSSSNYGALRLCDGLWRAKSSSGAWSNYYRQKKFPHWFTFRLGDAGATVDRMVVYNTASDDKRRVKQLEIQVADRNRPNAFRSVGKFECKAVDDRQEFKFAATKARFVKLLIHSNNGDPSYTQIGEVQLYGPGRSEELFGVRFYPNHRGSGDIVPVDAKHWLAVKPKQQGYYSTPSRRGMFGGWEKSGFKPVFVDKAAPKALASTLCKPVGKGFIILETLDLGARVSDGAINWRVWNLLGLKPTRVARRSANWGIGRLGRDRIRVSVEPGLYYVRVRDSQERNWSLEKFRMRMVVTPVPRPFEPNDTPGAATWLVSGRSVRTTIFPSRDVDWFRMAVARKGPVRVEIVDVPDAVDPSVAIYAAGKFNNSLSSFSGTQGGGSGYPEMFTFNAPAPGVYYLKLTGGYSRSVEATTPMTLVARFDESKKPVAPALVSASPGDGVVGVGTRPRIRMNFDRPMSTAKSRSDAIQIGGSKSGAITATIDYDPLTYQAILVPKKPLVPGETVTVRANSGLAGVFGGRLAKVHTWSFTVIRPDAGGKPVSVRVTIDPSPVGVGSATVAVIPSRKLRGAPDLTAKASNGARLPVGKLTRNDRGQWVAKLTIPRGTPPGAGTFSVRGIDDRGRAVSVISEGERFIVDTQPPPVMAGLKAAPAGEGRARLTWARLEAVPDLGGYRLYRSTRNTNRRANATMVKAADGADFLTWEDPTPRDATWYYFIAAVDKAGNEGPPSPAAGVKTDRIAPTQAIAKVTVKIEKKPRIDIAWKATTDREATGYSVFRFKQDEPQPKRLAEAKPLTELPRDRTTLQDFPPDGAYVYVVCGRDDSGNLGPASKAAKIVLDTKQTQAQFKLSSKPPLSQGDHTAEIKLTEPLAGDLTVAVRMPDGKERPLKPVKKDDLTYTVKMSFSEKDPEGWADLKLDGVDRYGNKGIRMRTYNRFYVDTGPPKASIYTTPRSGRLGAGVVQVRVEFGEDVKDGPTLFCVAGARKLPVALKRDRYYKRRFTGALTIPKDFPNGPAKFALTATDLRKHTGGIILRGETFEADTVAPEAPLNVTVRPGANKALTVSWTAPTREPIDFFRLYGAPNAAVRPGKDTLLADKVRGTKIAHTPKANQVLWFAVAAVDRAGNESPLSRVIKGEPDTTPPPPPSNLALKIEVDGRVRLTWTPPRTNEKVRYHVYRGLRAIAAIAGLKPAQQTAEAFVLDDPRKTAMYYYIVTAVDEAGNQSTPVVAPVLDFDTEPPTATVTITPKPGLRSYSDAPYQWYKIGVLAAGEKTVTLTPSEPLSAPPTLRYRMRSIDQPRELPLTDAGGGKWQGKLTVPVRTNEGLLTFFFEGVDRKKNRGRVIPKGSGNKFWIDTTAPEAVASLELKSQPRGKVAMKWSPPPGDSRNGVTFAIYRTDKAFTSINGMRPVVPKLANKDKYIDEPPRDGTYHYAVVATDLGGNVGRVYKSAAVASDGTPPAAPTGLKTAVKGEILVSWQAPEATGLVYRVLRGADVIATRLPEPQLTDAPENDGTYEYRVEATDAAGNASPLSAPVTIRFTNTLPTAVIEIEPPSPVRSTFRVTCTTSRALKGAPELFLHLAHGTPKRVATEKRDAGGTKWVGSVQVITGSPQGAQDTPNGPAKFTFLGISTDGLRGNRIRKGAEIMIDTRPPHASVALQPGSPLRSGKVKLIVTPSEPLKETPKLSYTTMGAPGRVIELKPDGKSYVGEIEITDADKDGTAFFEFSGIDRAGNVGTGIGPKHFMVDNHAPKPPTKLVAKTEKQGYVELAWHPPFYKATETRDKIAGYNIYAAQAPFKTVADLKPLLARTARLPARVRPPMDGKWYVAVTTVDTAGLESTPSNVVECVSDRSGPTPPRITKSESLPAGIQLTWDAPKDAVSFGVTVHLPGERGGRRVAKDLKVKTFTFRPLRGGEYTFWIDALDSFGHRSRASAPARVNFEQKAALAILTLPGKSLGRGTHKIQMETTLPLTRAPKLQLVPAEGKPIAVAMTGAGRAWSGTLTIDKTVKSGTARFEYEGSTRVDGREVRGTGLLSDSSVRLDFDVPTAAVVFDRRMPMRGRKVILKGGQHRFALRSSEPLRDPPRLTFTPRGRDTQVVELTPTSDTSWTASLVVDEKIGDGSGLFEIALTDRQGNTGDEVTANRNVEIDTSPPNRITKIRAAALPGGKVRVDWIPPYFQDGKLDTEANTFYIYRGESELKDVAGLSPHRVVQRMLGFVDRPAADRRYYYAVIAVDRAGNMGQASRSASVHVDKNPPKAPREMRAKQTDTGVVHLSWKHPEGEKPLFYNVYLAKHPIATTKGMTPKNPGVTWTEIYGTPNENGTYYFAVTSVDGALNESDPCESVMLEYKAIAPIAKFKIEPDIWVKDGEYKVRLETSKPLIEPPKVVINSEHDKKYPIRFEGSGAQWGATLKIDKAHPPGTYGFIFRGKDAEGNTGDEILSGPLFHIDKTAPLSPGELKILPDSKGTPGAVVLHWVTPKKKNQQTEVPHFYNIYRSTGPIKSIKGMAPVHTYKVIYENLDDYHLTDMPPANGTYHYVVTSLDMARNESKPSNEFKVTVQSDSPRATLDLFNVIDGKPSPVATDEKGRPVVGSGTLRMVVKTTSKLRAAPKIIWHMKRQDDKTTAIPMTGSGATWQGDFEVKGAFEDTTTAFFKFEGLSEGGAKGTFIRKGDQFRIDPTGPVAEIIIPSAYKMKVHVKSNKLVVPPVHLGKVKVKLTTDEDLAQAPELHFKLDDGGLTPVPMTGFGRVWYGWMDIPFNAESQKGVFEYQGVDRSGNMSDKIAVRRYPYDADDNFPPRKIANYATTGGEFTTDTVAADAPMGIETEMRKLGVAVIKWKEPAGDPASYNLYRALTPITSVDGMRPIKDTIYAPIIVDDPPVDGNYFYAVTAVDMAGNESPVSESKSVFIDTIKPELKITAVPSGDDFIILMDENAPPELSLVITFPGQKSRKVTLGGSSGELQKYEVRRMPGGRRGIVLPQMAEFFNGRVEVIVHSPDPEGNIVEEKTEVEMKKIAASAGGEVASADEQVQLVIPPGLKPVIPKGPNEVKRVDGYEHLFFIQYANIPDKKPVIPEGEKRRRDQVDPIPPGLEVVGRPYVIQMNLPPEEPLQLKASASQADLSQLTQLTAKLNMKVPTMYSDAVEDPDYLKSRLKVIKWLPARSDDEPGKWVMVPDVEVDVESKSLIVPATDITTYVIVAERTPPSIFDMKPERGDSVTSFRPKISCRIVDKGTGVAMGAENRIVLSIDGKKIEEKFVTISKGDPTDVKVEFTPPKDLTPGAHIVGIRAEDVVENVANVKWQFIVDNKPPVFESVSPEQGERLPVARPIIQAVIRDQGGIDPERTKLTIDGESVAATHALFDEATGLLTCAWRTRLSSGTHAATLLVYDKAGLSSEKTWAFTTDLDAPELTSILPAPGSTVDLQTDKIALKLEDRFGSARVLDLRVNGARIAVGRQGKKDGYVYDVKTGKLTYAAPKAFGMGEHRVAALVADDLGNTREQTWLFTGKPGAPAASAYLAPVEVKAPKAVAAEKKALSAAKLGFAAMVKSLDMKKIRTHTPDAVPEVKQLLREAETLEAAKQLDASAEKYSEASSTLADAQKEAVEAELPPIKAEIREKFETAKQSFAGADNYADRSMVAKHKPEVLKTVDAAVKEAKRLEAARELEKSAEAYATAAKALADADKAASEIERFGAIAALKAQFTGLKAKYAALLPKVDRQLLAKHLPDVLPATEKLAGEAEVLGAAEKYEEAAVKYGVAVKRLGSADKQARELEATAGARAAQARFDAAKKTYDDAAGKADKTLIRKHRPAELASAEKLAAQAAALADEKKLLESASAYEQAAAKLSAIDKTSREIERLGAVAALKARFTGEKTRYTALTAQVDRRALGKHLPNVLPAVEKLAREAEALGAAEKYEEAAAKYGLAVQQLGPADKQARALEAAVVAKAAGARFDAAKKAYDDATAKVDKALIRKHRPAELAAVNGLAAQALALAGEKKLMESASAYEQAAAKLSAADKTARETERLGATAALRARLDAAKKDFNNTVAKVDAAKIQKYVPTGLPAVGKIVSEADNLARAGKFLESAAKYTAAATTLRKIDTQAARLAKAATEGLQQKLAALAAARKAYVDALKKADDVLIKKHTPADYTAAGKLARQAEEIAAAKLYEAATTKYGEALAKLKSAGARALQLEQAASAAARARFDAAKKRCTDAVGRANVALVRKHAAANWTAATALLRQAGDLGIAGKFDEGAAKYDAALVQLSAASKKAAAAERAGPERGYRAAKQAYADALAVANVALMKKHTAADYAAAVGLVGQADALGEARLFAPAATKYAEALAKLKAADAQARKLGGATVTGNPRERFDAARKRCVELIGKVNVATVKKYAAAEWGVAMLLLQDANGLGAEGKFGPSADKYVAALEKARIAVAKARRLKGTDPMVAFGQAKQSYVDAMATVDQRLIVKHAPNVFPAVAKLTNRADVLARLGRHAEATPLYAEAARKLTEADRAAKVKEKGGARGDAVDEEMKTIRALAQRGDSRNAADHITNTLVKKWQTHRNKDWAALSKFVADCQTQYPRLKAVGRLRFRLLDARLKDFAKQEKAWAGTQQKVNGMRDVRAKIREVESFIRYNYNGLYESAARKQLQKLKDDLVRQGGKG
jgi:fibronectin type 3 domain-containing protein